MAHDRTLGAYNTFDLREEVSRAAQPRDLELVDSARAVAEG